MKERVRAHTAIVTGCLRPLEHEDRTAVFLEAAQQLEVTLTRKEQVSYVQWKREWMLAWAEIATAVARQHLALREIEWRAKRPQGPDASHWDELLAAARFHVALGERLVIALRQGHKWALTGQW